MSRIVKRWKRLGLASTCGTLLVFGTGCLPDDVFAEAAGEIVKGVILSAVNLFLSGTGLQV